MSDSRGYRELTGPKGRALVTYAKELGEDITGEKQQPGQTLIPVSVSKQGRSGLQSMPIAGARENQTIMLRPKAAPLAKDSTETDRSKVVQEDIINPEDAKILGSTTADRILPGFEVLFRNKAPILLEELERVQSVKKAKALGKETTSEEDLLLGEDDRSEGAAQAGEQASIEAKTWFEAALRDEEADSEDELVIIEEAGIEEDVWITVESGSDDNQTGDDQNEKLGQEQNLDLDQEQDKDLEQNKDEPADKQVLTQECNDYQIELFDLDDSQAGKKEPVNVVELAVQPKNNSLPEINLLTQGRRSGLMPFTDDILEKASLLEETLASFGVRAQVTDFAQGPTITRFEVQPAPGVKVSRIVALADDIALALAAADVRIEAPIPGKAVVGIEVPNREPVSVSLREVLESKNFIQAKSKLSVVLGKDISGEPVVANLVRMPHLLIAGATGSGKSVCLNSLIISLLYKARPHEVKFLMIDPKMVELSTYNGIPHLIAPVITDPKQATAALRWVVTEMENRYNLFAQTGVKNLESYNELQKAIQGNVLPLVVVLIDELSDLMMVASRDVEEAICRLAQMARAAGIHLVIATQRPSVDVITGIIKANIPSRIAFAVSSQVDSRTILDMAGAEKLLGRGDMLFSPIGAPKPVRVQGAFVSDVEVEKVVGFWKSQGKPEYLEGVLQQEAGRASNWPQVDEDELLSEATKLIIESGQASVSMLQRRFRIGYTRAARLIDLMQEKGFIGGYEGSKPREVLVSKEEWQEIFG